jgi:hypothetical protein
MVHKVVDTALLHGARLQPRHAPGGLVPAIRRSGWWTDRRGAPLDGGPHLLKAYQQHGTTARLRRRPRVSSSLRRGPRSFTNPAERVVNSDPGAGQIRIGLNMWRTHTVGMILWTTAIGAE